MEYFRKRFVDELNEEGDIEIRGNAWPRQVVLATMDTIAYENHFSDWVGDAKAAAMERAGDFLNVTGGLERFQALGNRWRKGLVLPFVGAGMSIPSGFQPWGAFLISLLVDAPHVADEVHVLIGAGRYEEAAQRAHDALGADVLAEEIANRLGSHRREVRGPVQLLPLLFAGEVITTNFDYVLTNAFDLAGCRFVREYSGNELRDAAARLGNDPHCLLRLHGEADVAGGRVLTSSEYDLTYTADRTVQGMLSEIIGTRSLLFLGCGLNHDRTLNALRELKHANRAGGPPHYAFLPFPGEARRASRRKFLAEAGIHPIYYDSTEPDQCIEDLLVSLMEGGLNG